MKTKLVSQEDKELMKSLVGKRVTGVFEEDIAVVLSYPEFHLQFFPEDDVAVSQNANDEIIYTTIQRKEGPYIPKNTASEVASNLRLTKFSLQRP